MIPEQLLETEQKFGTGQVAGSFWSPGGSVEGACCPRGSIKGTEPRVDADRRKNSQAWKLLWPISSPVKNTRANKIRRPSRDFVSLPYVAGGVAGVSQYGFRFITAQTLSHHTRCPPFGEVPDDTNDECKHTA